MSLINEMLTDLERRRGGRQFDAEHVFEGVHAVGSASVPGTRASTALRLLATILIGVTAACVAWYGLRLLDSGPARIGEVAAGEQVVAATSEFMPPARKLAPLANAAPLKDMRSEQPEPRDLALAAPLEQPPERESPAVAGTEAAYESAPGKNMNTNEAPASAQVPAVAAVEFIVPEDASHTAVEYSGTVLKARLEPVATPRTELSAIMTRLGDDRGVLAELADFVTEHTDYVAAREAYVTELMRDGKMDAAEQCLREGLGISLREPRYALMLAHLLFNRGEVESALAQLTSATPDQHDADDYNAFIAALQQRLGRHGEAIVTYRQALNQTPGRGVWWVGLGISLTADNQPGPAQQAFRRALGDRDLSDNMRRYAEREIGRLNGSS